MSRQSARVLIVDNDVPRAHFLAQVLTATRGVFCIYHAATVNDAVQFLHRQEMDLIFLDLHLPNSGCPIQLCARLLKESGNAAVLIMAASADADLAMRAIRYGAQDCFLGNETDGAQLIRRSLLAMERQKLLCHRKAADSNGVGRDVQPMWHSGRRELIVGTMIVKRFRQASPNQTTVLAAFQEEDWPNRIDDPLPQDGEMDPKERLRAAIRSLNNHQRHKLVLFSADGTGCGVCWQFISDS